MKAYLADLVRAAPTPAHGRNVAREYLQARILGAMQRAGAMIPLAFHGRAAPGETAMRRGQAAMTDALLAWPLTVLHLDLQRRGQWLELISVTTYYS